jgi:hypothetical protein
MSDIHIHQFNAQYNIARSLNNPAALQRRLDQVASELLAGALEARFSNWLDSDELVCFIEHMTVDLTLDPAKMDDRELAAFWASGLQEGIVKTLSQRGNSVILFRNRGEFLASFLEDLLAGRAWDYWYYQEFDALRSLSLGQAVLTLLVAEGDTGRDALLELTQRDCLERLLAILTDDEVEAIAIQCLLPPGPSVVLPNTVGIWVQRLRSLLSRVRLTNILMRDVMRLYLGLLDQHPELGPDVNLARFIRDLLQLRQTLATLDRRSAVLSYLADDDLRAALNQLDRGRATQLLTTLMPELRGVDVVALLQDLQVDAAQPIGSRTIIPYGGIFLLVEAIADLELYNFLQQCPYSESPNFPKANLLLWLIALQCMGQPNVERTQRDRGLAVFAGFSQPPATALLQSYAVSLTPEMHAAFIQAFQTHLQTVLRRPNLFLYQRSLLSSTPAASDWFSLSESPVAPCSNSQWDGALAEVSRTILQGFAIKLGAFADSSPSYLCRNFLESQAEIEVSSSHIRVHFLTCPLQMVLRMAGFDHFTWEVPWLENRQLAFEFD